MRAPLEASATIATSSELVLPPPTRPDVYVRIGPDAFLEPPDPPPELMVMIGKRCENAPGYIRSNQASYPGGGVLGLAKEAFGIRL